MKSILKIPVRGYHIDHFGHVNHGRYVELLEEARWHYLEENGLMDAIHAAGAIHVVSGITVEYKYPARAGQVLRFETRIARCSQNSFLADQKAFLDGSGTHPGKLVIKAVVTNTFIDTNGRPKEIDDDMLAVWPDLADASAVLSEPDASR